MVGKPFIDFSKARPVAGEQTIDQRYALTDVERLVHRQARAVEQTRMVARRVERHDNRSPGNGGDHGRPEPGCLENSHLNWTQEM